ncbi:MAG: O-antigen ligase family protein [Desulfobacterales bacterium]|nr:O-antigen ligase family protein [Desulfobacterales bacterium]
MKPALNPKSYKRLLLYLVYAAAFTVPLLILPGVTFDIFSGPKSSALILLAIAAMLVLLFVVLQGSVALPSTLPAYLSFGFLFYMALTIIWSPLAHISSGEFMLLASFLIFFWISMICLDGRRITTLVQILFFTSALSAAYAFFQYLGIDFFRYEQTGYIVGTIGNPNSMSSFFLSTFFLGIYLSIDSRRRRRLLSVVLLSFILVLIVMCRSRGAWVGLFVGSSTCLVLAIKSGVWHSLRHLKSYVAASLMTLAVLLSIACVLQPARYSSIVSAKSIFDPKTLYDDRINYNRAGWEMFKAHPLLGSGLKTFRREVYDYQARINQKDPAYLDPYMYTAPYPKHVHNDYLEFADEIGLIGLLTFLSIVGVVFTHGWHSVKTTADPKGQWMRIALLSNLTGILVHALFFFPLRLPATGMVFWLNLAMIEVLAIPEEKRLRIYQLRPAPFSRWIRAAAFAVGLFLAFFLVWRHAIAPLLGSHYFCSYLLARGKDESALLKALHYKPGQSYYQVFALVHYREKEEWSKANFLAENIIERFDGETPLWSAYHNLGIVRHATGQFMEAKKAYRRSLYYLPTFQPAINELRKVESIIESRLRRAVIRFRCCRPRILLPKVIGSRFRVHGSNDFRQDLQDKQDIYLPRRWRGRKIM